ncbi:hypothetical protein C3L50_08735 [Flavobacterium alvei]|uniref:Uncharacterized protein n=1 Tax=Flavobacterium alvei TaxID=2080416 RepID=A0A2S5ACC9_9FLAO|nr:hypothetical protein [Flavobacterium alvei]POY39907.1 hypothetical protein C3L50_08735 [Flavobacterium alvei]
MNDFEINKTYESYIILCFFVLLLLPIIIVAYKSDLFKKITVLKFINTINKSLKYQFNIWIISFCIMVFIQKFFYVDRNVFLIIINETLLSYIFMFIVYCILVLIINIVGVFVIAITNNKTKDILKKID